MTRHSCLPHAPLLAVSLVAALAWPATGWCQDRATQDRLDRLERDLNMLQRQVYRGVPPPAMAGGDPNMAASTEIRLERLEGEMRDLNGRVEEYANQMDQLRQRLEQINSDIDVRFGQLSGAALAAGPAAGPPPRSGGPRQPAPDPGGMNPGSGGLTPAGGPMPPGTVVPAPIFGTLTPPGEAPPGSEMASAPPGRPSAAGGLPTGSASEQYNYAFGLLKQADYPAAEQALRAFVQQHPEDAMAGSAQYWIGESLFTRRKYAEAAAAFAEGYRRYPKSPKAAEELLRLGMSLGRAKQKDNACVALGQLDRDFPNSGAAIRERAAAEKKRLGC